MRRPSLAAVLFLALTAAALTVACTRPELDAGAGNPTGEELYADSFAEAASGAWLLETDEDGRSEIVDGALVITVDVPNTIQFATLTEAEFADFVAEVDVVQLQGDLQSSYGLLFRMQEDGRFYRFDITGDGRYIVEQRTISGEWRRLTPDWRSSSALVSGLNSANRLRVEA
ncbi:MAG: hypothetical protein R3300_16735, partial [Candidatus Promineifilaceae bacterium]|nr:hypothetical protein [Candidatus Promineifilaceae bacterium]